MKTVMCRICERFFKKRRVGRTLEFCGECKQLSCTAHITDVVHREKPPTSYGIVREVHTRTCKLCLAERALTTA